MKLLENFLWLATVIMTIITFSGGAWLLTFEYIGYMPFPKEFLLIIPFTFTLGLIGAFISSRIEEKSGYPFPL